MAVFEGQRCRACAHFTFAELGGHRSVLVRVFAGLILAIVVVMGAMCAFAVVVACAALVLWICMALVVRVLGIRPMHMAGLLGGPFMRSLLVASAAPAVCLVLTVVDPLALFTALIGVVAVVPPAVLMPLAICEALELVMVTTL